MVAHEGFVLVFGGMLDGAYSRLRCPLWVFDILKQKWVHCRGKSQQAETPSNRKGHSAVVIGSSMLVYGGYVDLKGSSAEFWSLDLDSMVWSPVAGSPVASLGPGPRHSHSCAALHSCMYLYGGLKGLREQRDFWMWNSNSSTWSSLKTKSGPSKLIGHTAIAYKDCLLVFGGCESQNSPHNFLWRYSLTSQSWSQVPAHPGSKPPPKFHHCCVGLGPSYLRNADGSISDSPQPSPIEDKIRRFKNKCFPSPLGFLGSENDIELELLTPDKGGEADCLTFENKALRRSSSSEEEGGEARIDLSHRLPDMLLVFGGRPCTLHGNISVWQMTLTDS